MVDLSRLRSLLAAVLVDDIDVPKHGPDFDHIVPILQLLVIGWRLGHLGLVREGLSVFVE